MTYSIWCRTREVYSQKGELLFGQWISAAGGVDSNTKYYLFDGKAVLEANTAASVAYLHTDALGSPVLRTNSSKAVQSGAQYDPWGDHYAGTEPFTIGYTGHVNDVGTGLVQMQQRYYDPLIGRFMSADPVRPDAATGGNFNRYWYANNSPYRYTDPDGRLAFLVPMAFGGVIGGGINLGAQLIRSGGDLSRVSWGQVGVAAVGGALAGGAGVVASTATTTGGMIGANAVAGAAISAGGGACSCGCGWKICLNGGCGESSDARRSCLSRRSSNHRSAGRRRGSWSGAWNCITSWHQEHR
ncbi:RHS repeat-associated core domain-containing protein [Ideonella sp.]|uniref:RHS repeat-associated core domain-containing protein n=1 Tax=Ideonella sp. TaxID=1929293 RepID=UPI003BB5DC1F